MSCDASLRRQAQRCIRSVLAIPSMTLAMPRVLSHSRPSGERDDRRRGTRCVGSGGPALWRPCATLEASGWALTNLPSLPHISVAGSVATATHGSGNANQSLASAVTAMSLITGTGDQVRIDQTSPDFPGAVVHLGALGVVTELTLAIKPTFEVRQVIYEHLPWDQLTDSFEEVMRSGYSVSAITDFAGNDVGMLWVKSRVDDDRSAKLPTELFGARAATEKLHMTPGNDPVHCTPQLGEPGPWFERLPHFLLEFTPSSGAEIQSEYLLDRRYASSAIDALRGLGHAIAPLVKSAEIRTVAADELWLSPASNEMCSAFISPGSPTPRPSAHSLRPSRRLCSRSTRGRTGRKSSARLTRGHSSTRGWGISAGLPRRTTRAASSAPPISRAPSWPEPPTRIHRCPVPTALCG